MTKLMKARKSGFTLVELLIVIVIIAILAGMLLLATGSATDSAEATRIINDLRNVKAAAMMFFVDNQVWPTLDGLAVADVEASLDRYLDRPFFGMNPKRFDLVIEEDVDVLGDTDNARAMIGFEVLEGGIPTGVRAKLVQNNQNSGLYDDGGAWYAGAAGDNTICMIMR